MNLLEIKQTLDSEAGKALKEYLLGRLGELRGIDNVKDCDSPTHQAIELKSQKKAFEKLKDILSEIMIIEESDVVARDKEQFFSM